MPRSLSTKLKAAMYAQETGDTLLARCTITHPQILNGPLRLVNDLQDFVSDGQTYTALPFQITLPNEGEDARPQLRLVLDNVDRQIVQAIRGIAPGTPPVVQVDLVLASTPDVVDISFPNLTLRNVDYDQFVVSGALSLDEDDREPIPYHSFTPQFFPGLF
jgi:Domain of unknown function (DUF1833).